VMKGSAMSARADTPSVRWMGISPIWCIFTESKMRPHTIVVGNIPANEPAQVLLSQDDRVIGAFSSNCSDYTFGIGVLPG
jgi:hypothetical protein